MAASWQIRRLRTQESALSFLFWSYVIERFPEASSLGNACNLKENWQIVSLEKGEPLFNTDCLPRKFFATVAGIMMGDLRLPLTDPKLRPIKKGEKVIGKIDDEIVRQFHRLKTTLQAGLRKEVGVAEDAVPEDFESWLNTRTVLEAKVAAAKSRRIGNQIDYADYIFWEMVFDQIPLAGSPEVFRIALREDWQIVDSSESETGLQDLATILVNLLGSKGSSEN